MSKQQAAVRGEWFVAQSEQLANAALTALPPQASDELKVQRVFERYDSPRRFSRSAGRSYEGASWTSILLPRCTLEW